MTSTMTLSDEMEYTTDIQFLYRMHDELTIHNAKTAADECTIWMLMYRAHDVAITHPSITKSLLDHTYTK